MINNLLLVTRIEPGWRLSDRGFTKWEAIMSPFNQLPAMRSLALFESAAHVLGTAFMASGISRIILQDLCFRWPESNASRPFHPYGYCSGRIQQNCYSSTEPGPSSGTVSTRIFSSFVSLLTPTATAPGAERSVGPLPISTTSPSLASGPPPSI